jgi:hypothetical protein
VTYVCVGVCSRFMNEDHEQDEYGDDDDDDEDFSSNDKLATDAETM